MVLFFLREGLIFRGVIKRFSKEVNYETEFTSAVKRSRRWKLEVPDIKLSKTPFLTGEKTESAQKFIQDIASKHTLEEFSQQCFRYMYFASRCFSGNFANLALLYLGLC